MRFGPFQNHEAYAEALLREATCSTAGRTSRGLTSLKDMCLQAASQHAAVLDMNALLELPASLIKELLPHLNISALDKIQPALNLRGISTYSAWVAVLQVFSRSGVVVIKQKAINIDTEEESKQEVMRKFFELIFYGYYHKNLARHISNVNVKSLLLVMAKSLKRFHLRYHYFLRSFTTEQRPLLDFLEKSVRCVDFTPCGDLLKRKTYDNYVLYVLHRMLDHGEAKELDLRYAPHPTVLAWILNGRGAHHANHRCHVKSMHGERASNEPASSSQVTQTESRDNDGDDATPCKRSKLDSVCGEEDFNLLDPEVLCQTFSPSAGHSPEACPRGQIQSLEIADFGPEILNVLIPILPTWLCLRSLTLRSNGPDVICRLDFVRSLKQLSETSGSSLADLSLGLLHDAEFTETLLDASPKLKSLSVHILPWYCGHAVTNRPRTVTQHKKKSELALEKLSVREQGTREIDLHSITSVLKRCPSLTSLEMSGIRLSAGLSPHQLLTTVSDSNLRLRRLDLEDINLADCLPEILSLLRNCMLEELSFRDCRLLERCSNKDGRLQQLVDSLKRVSSLHTLSLAQNRLAKSVPVLAQLFTGPSPSTVKKLDISSNFIQPAELLELGRQMEKHRPPHRVTLDLRRNPWDRDLELWRAALTSLRPACEVVIDSWRSTGTMADHISNM